MNTQIYPFKIAVCDDEHDTLKKIKLMTEHICKEENILAEIYCFESGTKLIELINSNKSFDLLLLDVMMPEQNGIELAQVLRKSTFDGSIVFISSNKEMALRGYEVSAARYIAKPVEEERLKEAVVYCYDQFKVCKELLIPLKNGTLRLIPKEIMYIETQGRGCRIIGEHKTVDTSLRISEFESEIGLDGFVRCHQGFLVNMRFIRIVKACELELLNGISIPVSKHRIKEVRKQFFSWMEK